MTVVYYVVFVLWGNDDRIGVCCDDLRIVPSPYAGIKTADPVHIFMRQFKVEYVDILCDSFRMD